MIKRLLLILASALLVLGCQKEVYHNITISVNPAEGGSVFPPSGPVLDDTSVSFNATPKKGYVFTGWSGSITGTENPKTVTVTQDMNVTANFEKVNPSLEGLDNYCLVWNDEFDYSGKPNTNLWERQIYPRGAVNNEEQAYVNSAESATVSDGILKIKVYMEDGQIKSARFHSRQLFQHAYYEARIRIPKGKGVWPAFWLMGIDAISGKWPLCGEVDILEAVGHMPEMVHSVVWSKNYSNNEYMVDYFLPTSRDEFHIYAAEITSEYVKIYVDNQ